MQARKRERTEDQTGNNFPINPALMHNSYQQGICLFVNTNTEAGRAFMKTVQSMGPETASMVSTTMPFGEK